MCDFVARSPQVIPAPTNASPAPAIKPISSPGVRPPPVAMRYHTYPEVREQTPARIQACSMSGSRTLGPAKPRTLRQRSSSLLVMAESGIYLEGAAEPVDARSSVPEGGKPRTASGELALPTESACNNHAAARRQKYSPRER